MKKIITLFGIVLVLFLSSCSKDSTEPEATTDTSNTDIPANPSNITVPEPTINNIQPTANITPAANNPGRIQVNLTGLINPATQNPIDLFYNAANPGSSNIFITEDGVVKGLKVTKVSTGNVLNADVVFTVDNSGSMSEEADSVAASITKFAAYLQASGLNVRFAVVGYDVYGQVAGGVNFTSAEQIDHYLNKRKSYYGYTVSGTNRTVGFFGSDSATLENKANGYASEVYDENGVVAVLFADTNYSWRAGAQRIFINFTDEPTQTGTNYLWNTAKLISKIGGKATVHTVFSEDTTYYSYWDESAERPWEMSKGTGGTIKFIDSYATGLDLTNLPVAGALSNSYLVEYVAGSTGKSHTVIITIRESSADGKREYIINY